MEEKPPPYPGEQGGPPPQAPPPPYPPGQPISPQPGPTYGTVNVVTGQPASTIIVSAPTVLTDVPMSCTCPYCHQHVLTAVEYQSGTMTWLICLILLLFGCWLGCCLIPFCVDSCKDVTHSCPNCKCYIGTFRRL